LTDFASRLGRIYEIRYDIYRKKFFIKFINNLLAQLTPFFFYSIGGYLVIQGELTFGALVAVLAAYKDMSAPWKELLTYYQRTEDARIKYDQVIDQFHPEGMLDPELQTTEPEAPAPLVGTLDAAGLGLVQDESVRLLEGLAFSLPLDAHVAIVGGGSSGKDSLGLLLARLVMPTSGRLVLAGRDMSKLPEAVTGRRLAYVGPNAHLFSASVRDNLLYGLKHRPLIEPRSEGEAAHARARALREAEVTGNAAFDPAADWVDYAAAGAEGAALTARMFEVLHAFDMDMDIYEMGLRGRIDPDRRSDFAAAVLSARAALRDRLAEPEIAALVEPFDEARYNNNASVAENLLFGTPVGSEFEIEGLAGNDYVRRILDKADLTADMIGMGHKVAETMVELLSDLPPGHEFFEHFSFIASDDLADYQALLARTRKLEPDALRGEDRERLLALPFKVISARHRLGLVDDAFQSRLLMARRLFRDELPASKQGAVAFFDPERYNAAASLQDNILFGKIAYGQAESAARVGAVVGEVVDALDMRGKVMEVGLDFDVGIGGGRLNAAQRQKLAIARCVLKRPDVLIINEATAAFDSPTQTHILAALRAEFAGRGLIWVMHRASHARDFDRILVLKSGRIVQDGPYEELDRPDTDLGTLIGAE
ncbi:MAG: ATP-binding cassette domain-containing protein, partial [Alphaproteobacteria bacterium]